MDCEVGCIRSWC